MSALLNPLKSTHMFITKNTNTHQERERDQENIVFSFLSFSLCRLHYKHAVELQEAAGKRRLALVVCKNHDEDERKSEEKKKANNSFYWILRILPTTALSFKTCMHSHQLQSTSINRTRIIESKSFNLRESI